MAPHTVPGDRATTSGEVGPSSQYVPALDGVRALAIAGVFLLHLDRAHFPGGAFGVDVFFVLSAFLITGILLREKQESGGVDFRAFYLRRAFRLVPALILWIALFAIPTALAEHDGRKIAWSSAGSLFYFSDFLEAWTHAMGAAFDQSWSLSVEEQFYLVWPAVLVVALLVLRRRSLKALFPVLVVLTLVSSFGVNSYFLPTGHLLAFALGAWGAYQQRYGLDRWLARFLRVPLLAPAACVVFLAASLLSTGQLGDHIVAVAVDVSAVALILALVHRPGGTTARTLGSRPFAWVGARSYGVYLYGLTLMQLIPIVTGWPLHEAAPLDVVATLIVAGLSYRVLEAPIRRKGRTWLAGRYPPRPRPVPAGSPAPAV
jgi:peptidoglycan/LPS O-acetylase OafA/YrhL